MNAAKKLIDILKENLKPSSSKISATYLKLVEVFPLQPLSSKAHHESALKVMEKLINHINNHGSTDEGIRAYFETLTALTGEYEKKHFEDPKVSGGEMLEYLMELKGLKQTDLSKELGGQSVVSDVLSGKRELNLKQIRALAKKLGVSPEVFI